jgi:hypothetical protein
VHGKTSLSPLANRLAETVRRQSGNKPIQSENGCFGKSPSGQICPSKFRYFGVQQQFGVAIELKNLPSSIADCDQSHRRYDIECHIANVLSDDKTSLDDATDYRFASESRLWVCIRFCRPSVRES